MTDWVQCVIYMFTGQKLIRSSASVAMRQAWNSLPLPVWIRRIVKACLLLAIPWRVREPRDFPACVVHR